MSERFVGIQIGPISFLDEGVEQVLDTLEEKGAVNALVIMALSWSEGASDRTKIDYVDHGINGSAQPHTFMGGAFWNPDPLHYQNTILKHFRTPDPMFRDVDILDMVVPAAKRRGMKVFPYFWETGKGDMPSNVSGFGQVVEVDVFGRKAHGPCFNNPDYRAWIFSITEEWLRRYDVDGVDWGIERQGPLTMSIVYGMAPTCFCPHCIIKGQQRGLDVERAREGFKKIYSFLKAVRAGATPRDGYAVTFLRLLLQHPEVLQWEKLWVDSQKNLYRELYGLVKFLDTEKLLGLGILQWINSFNPFLRAQHDYEELVGVCDWVKPVLYHIPAGARFTSLTENLQATILKDMSIGESGELLSHLLHLKEAPIDQLPTTGFSADYVGKETARLVQALNGAAKVYPGIGVGLPVESDRRIRPDDVEAAIRAAYRGGADGILLARSYADTALSNLEAAGRILRQLK